MNCPQCGLYLPDANVERCPRCGWTRPATTGTPTPTPGFNPWANPSTPLSAPTEAAPPPQYAPPQSSPSQGPTTPGWPSYGPGTTPSSMYPPTQQSTPDQAQSPQYDQFGQPGMPPYGTPAQPSVPLYGQPAPPAGPGPMYGQYGQNSQYGQYGQYAPPSMPMPMYGQAAPPSMGQQPGWGSPFPPPLMQPPRKSRTGLIVSLIVVLVLILGAGGGFLAIQANQNQQTGNGGTPTATVPSATATATPSNVLFQDSFTDPSTGWTNDSNCSYGSGGYHIKGSYICTAPAGEFTDATVSVTVKQISGTNLDPYGISVRIGPQFQYHYEFDIDSNGKWVVFKCGSNDCSKLKDYTANAAIHANLNVSNTLSVAMKGGKFTFSINGTQLGQVSDSAYSSGDIGLNGSDGIEVVYSNFEITSA